MLYSIGHNVAGYLPETDVKWFANREDAVVQLVSDMREYASTNDETTWEALPGDAETARAHGYAVTDEGIDYGDDWPSMLATVESVLTDGPDAGSGSWSTSVEDGSGRRIAFWLQEHDFSPEYTYIALDGYAVSIEKVGGGTIGRVYEGTWAYLVREENLVIACGIDFESVSLMTHARAAREILDIVRDEV
jgi:hypothetical protein